MAARPAVTGAGPDVGRRAVLIGAAALLLGACSDDDSPSRAPVTAGRIAYGDEHPDQYGTLGLPDGDPRAVVVLLHGGFWSRQYAANLLDPLAADLRGRGYATWNVEYRRLGAGGGYPQTLADVAAAIDHVAELGVASSVPVTVIGHSAGGHLAVWAASRTERTPGGKPRVLADTTISLGGVLDMTDAARTNVGLGAVQLLLGGTPADVPEVYDLADPAVLVPAHGSVVAVQARRDQLVPPSQAKRYVDADLAAGGAASVVTVPGDHFTLIDPRSEAWSKVLPLIV